LARQRQRPRLDARPAGDSRRTVASAVAAGAEREVELALLDFPDAPLELVSGRAQVSGATVSSPTIRVRNRSGKAVRYFELGWLVRDAAGTSYAAGSVPAPASELRIEPGETLATGREQYFLFTRRGGSGESSFAIDGMTGYIKQVQFDDGTLWIPARQRLVRSALAGAIPVSPEEQRLSDLYRTKGLNALVEELARF
jgi:hypothetical protein